MSLSNKMFLFTWTAINILVYTLLLALFFSSSYSSLLFPYIIFLIPINIFNFVVFAKNSMIAYFGKMEVIIILTVAFTSSAMYPGVVLFQNFVLLYPLTSLFPLIGITALYTIGSILFICAYRIWAIDRDANVLAEQMKLCNINFALNSSNGDFIFGYSNQKEGVFVEVTNDCDISYFVSKNFSLIQKGPNEVVLTGLEKSYDRRFFQIKPEKYISVQCFMLDANISLFSTSQERRASHENCGLEVNINTDTLVKSTDFNNTLKLLSSDNDSLYVDKDKGPFLPRAGFCS
ncbi:MAG: hypothetical protein ACON5A_05460 [Candidatus Comchoanobacterales bacterium]